MKLEGFLIDLHSPSEANLEIEVDCSDLDWKDYRSLITDLEDVLSIIDETHSARSWLVKGRSLRARYSRITADKRTRRLRFCPYPSKFPNVLTSGRVHVYSLVSQYCLVLESIGTRKVYLLPKAVAPIFISLVEALNDKLLEPLKKDIQAFRSDKDWLQITSTLTKYGINPQKLNLAIPYFGNFRVDIIPIDFNYNVDKDKFYNLLKMDHEIDKVDLLKNQIERKYKEYLLNATKDIMERLTIMSQDFDTKKSLRFFRNRLTQLITLSNSLGMANLVSSFLDPVLEISKLPTKERKEALKKRFDTMSLTEATNKFLESYRF